MPTPSSLIRRLGISSYVYGVAGHHIHLSPGFRYDIQFTTRRPEVVQSRVSQHGVRMNYRGHMYTWHLRGLLREQKRSGSATWMRLSGDLIADSPSSSMLPSAYHHTYRRVAAAAAASSPSPRRRRMRAATATKRGNNTPTRRR